MSDQDAPQQSRDTGEEDDSIATQASASTGRGTRRSTRAQQRGTQPASRARSTERQFLFIDASTDRGASGEAVRVHVMREAHRTRRERQGIQAQPQRRRTAAQDEIVMFDARNPSHSTSVSTSGSLATTPLPDLTDQTSAAAAAAVAGGASSIDWAAVVRTGMPSPSTTSIESLHVLAEGCKSSPLHRHPTNPSPSQTFAASAPSNPTSWTSAATTRSRCPRTSP